MDEHTRHSKDIALVELLDRLLEQGVVLSGDITISVADVDLIYLGLRVLIRTPLEADRPVERSGSFTNSEGSDDLLLRVRDRAEQR